MSLTYYNINVKSLCVWGSQNLSSDKYVPRYLIRQGLSVSSGQRVRLKKNYKIKYFFYDIPRIKKFDFFFKIPEQALA